MILGQLVHFEVRGTFPDRALLRDTFRSVGCRFYNRHTSGGMVLYDILRQKFKSSYVLVVARTKTYVVYAVRSRAEADWPDSIGTEDAGSIAYYPISGRVMVRGDHALERHLQQEVRRRLTGVVVDDAQWAVTCVLKKMAMAVPMRYGLYFVPVTRSSLVYKLADALGSAYAAANVPGVRFSMHRFDLISNPVNDLEIRKAVGDHLLRRIACERNWVERLYSRKDRIYRVTTKAIKTGAVRLKRVCAEAAFYEEAVGVRFGPARRSLREFRDRIVAFRIEHIE